MSFNSGANANPLTDNVASANKYPFTLVHPLSRRDVMEIRVEPTYLDDSKHETQIKDPHIPILDQVTYHPSEFDINVFEDDPANCEKLISFSEFAKKCKELSKEFDENIQLCNKKWADAVLPENLDRYSKAKSALLYTRSKFLDWIKDTSTEIVLFNHDRYKSDCQKIRKAIKSSDLSDQDTLSELLEGCQCEPTRNFANSQRQFSHV